VLNILGFDRFVAAVAKALSSRKRPFAAVMDVLQRLLMLFRTQISLRLSILLTQPSSG
jgi:nitrate reductase assembly molybdenum cofactor insertion protein NarJ